MQKRTVIKWAVTAVIAIAAYFVYVEINTYLGKKALAETGLNPLELETAFKEARGESKLVLAGLSAIWCPNCRKLDNQVFSNAKVKELIRDKYVFARVEYETEEGKAFQKRYGVRGFPNLLILDHEGNLVRKLDIDFEAERFAQQL